MVVLNAFKRFCIDEYALFPLNIISITSFLFTVSFISAFRKLSIQQDPEEIEEIGKVFVII